MKWKNEIPNKTEFMKMNSFNFIENEKFNSELVHEKNVGKIQTRPSEIQSQKEEVINESRSQDNNLTSKAPHQTDNNKEQLERRTMTETITLTQSKTDFEGSAPKRYTTTCYIKPVTVPVWYTESLLLHINSTKCKYEEKVHFKNKLIPFRWSENMSTEIKTGPKCVLSEVIVPVDESDYHYISLEAQQQLAAPSTDL